MVDKNYGLLGRHFRGKFMLIPRKPTALGIVLKIITDTANGILLNEEIVEGAGVDARK